MNSSEVMNPVLFGFWMTPSRYKVLYGGRASSKSWAAAAFAIFLANRFKLRFLCTRQIQNKIEESVYALLKIQIERFGLSSRFRILNNKIINTVTGSEFMFYGLWRHTSEIKSLEGVDVLWLEEAQSLTSAQWEILEPTIRKEHSECWFIFNPQLVTDFVWQNFVVTPPKDSVVRRINYDENPFLSKTMRDVIQAHKEREPDTFDHIYLGEPLADDDDSVIKRSWIESAVDAHKLLGFAAEGQRIIGFDVADEGEDANATALRHGSVLLTLDTWRRGDIIDSSARVGNQALEQRADRVVFDSIGVGAGVKAWFNKNSRVLCVGFNAGGAVSRPDAPYMPKKSNKDMFANAKAQAWWQLRDRFQMTHRMVTLLKEGEKIHRRDIQVDKLISISSDIKHLEQLKFELAAPRVDYDQNGRVKVESKKDLKKRDIKSPNLADAVVMAFAPITGGMKVPPELVEKLRRGK